MLMGCYRKDDVADPDIFSASVARVFMGYPGFVAYLACDPLRGVPSKSRFFPSIAEVKQFCDDIVSEKRSTRRQAEQINAQIEERKRLPAPEETPELRAGIVAKVLEQHGEHFGIKQPEGWKPPSLEELGKKYPGGALKGLKLSAEAKAAINRRMESLTTAEAEDDGDAD